MEITQHDVTDNTRRSRSRWLARNRRSGLVATVAATIVFGVTMPVSAQLSGPRKMSYRLGDNAYSPKTALKVRRGETITFTFVNRGKVPHEALIGTVAEQAAHEKEMAKMSGMGMNDEADRVTLKPGQTKTVKFTFAKAGRYEIGCHQPSHYGLGMKVPVDVS